MSNGPNDPAGDPEATAAATAATLAAAEAAKKAEGAEDARRQGLALTQTQLEENISAEKALETQLLQNKVILQELTPLEAALTANLLEAEAAYRKQRIAVLKATKGSAEHTDAVDAMQKAYKEFMGMKGIAGANARMGDFAGSLRSTTTNLITAATGIKTTGNAFTGFIKTLGEGAKKSDIFFKSFQSIEGKTLQANLAFGVAAGVMSKFAEATMSAVKTNEELYLALGRDTGIAASREATRGIMEMSRSHDNAAVSGKSLGTAIGELQIATEGMFGNLAEGDMTLALFAEDMRSTGVSVQSTGELFKKFGAILGSGAEGTVPAIMSFEKDIVRLAKTLHMSSNQMVRDVAGMADALAQFGESSKDIALDIAEISAVTKVGSTDILKFTKSFEYLPDAIQKANELNLVFGRTIITGRDMWEMMNDGTKGPAEAFKFAMSSMAPIIDDAFLKSVPKMRAFANQLGMSGTAASHLAEKLHKARDNQTSFNKVIQQAVADRKSEADALQTITSLSENLAKFQEKFAIMLQPISEGLALITESLASMSTGAARLLGVGLIAAFAALGYKLTKTIQQIRQMGMAMAEAALKGSAGLDVYNAKLQQTNTLSQQQATGGKGGMGGMFGKMGKMKGGALGMGIGMAAHMGAGAMEEGSTGQKVVSGLGNVASMTAMGAMFGPWGAGIGALLGLGMAASDLMDDGIIVSSGGNIEATRINSRDDVKIMAQKPGGPLASAENQSALSGPALSTMIASGVVKGMLAAQKAEDTGPTRKADAVEIVVNLFGKELVRKLVDLVDEEHKSQRLMEDAMSGRKP